MRERERGERGECHLLWTDSRRKGKRKAVISQELRIVDLEAGEPVRPVSKVHLRESTTSELPQNGIVSPTCMAKKKQVVM